MEYTQWEQICHGRKTSLCLNPCCNGIYSMSGEADVDALYQCVLILVVMEYTQWGHTSCSTSWQIRVLILVVMEYTQWAYSSCNRIEFCFWVLILVVMEYTQWAVTVLLSGAQLNVLILVVMEYTQWGLSSRIPDKIITVLILVVMEYTQWEETSGREQLLIMSLNPCCNGIYSMRNLMSGLIYHSTCLNPCCNGIYSMRK